MHLTDTASYLDGMAQVDELLELNFSECAGIASMGRQTIVCGCGKTVVIEADDEDDVVAELQEKGWYARKHGASLICECPKCAAETDNLVEEQGW